MMEFFNELVIVAVAHGFQFPVSEELLRILCYSQHETPHLPTVFLYFNLCLKKKRVGNNDFCSYYNIAEEAIL